MDPKYRNKPQKEIFDFAKQTENQPKQIEFRFESKILFVCFEDTFLYTIVTKNSATALPVGRQTVNFEN
jgi:hypothetical protein